MLRTNFPAALAAAISAAPSSNVRTTEFWYPSSNPQSWLTPLKSTISGVVFRRLEIAHVDSQGPDQQRPGNGS